MADPALPFIHGLRCFQRVACYANASFDRTVPYRTSSISLNAAPLRTELIRGRTRYPHIGQVYDDDEPIHDWEAEAAEADGTEEHSEYKVGLRERMAFLAIPLMFLLFIVPMALVMTGFAVASAVRGSKDDEFPLELLKRVGEVPHDFEVTSVVSEIEIISESKMLENGSEQLPVVKTRADAEPKYVEIHRNLRSYLRWRRVDVHLPGPHTHGRIVVRRPWADACGRDVIRHMARYQFRDVLAGIAQKVECVDANCMK
eukprot:ANDGO_06604.mRNA.1 hypothetical protein